MRIAYIDDDPDDLQSFSEALQQIDPGHELILLEDCLKLTKQIDQNMVFDLIILDINLPIINGIECLSKLKDNEKTKHIPIVMLSGSENEPQISNVYELGAHYHIVKPYAHINLVASLKIILNINWQNHPAVPPRENFVINLTFNK
jgi:DNA-binding response OmpR family regulator